MMIFHLTDFTAEMELVELGWEILQLWKLRGKWEECWPIDILTRNCRHFLLSHQNCALQCTSNIDRLSFTLVLGLFRLWYKKIYFHRHANGHIVLCCKLFSSSLVAIGAEFFFRSAFCSLLYFKFFLVVIVQRTYYLLHII